MISIEEFSREFNISLSLMWQQFFVQELQKDYFAPLIKEILKEYEENIVYPPKSQLWHAFILTPFENLKGVLLGQDPYHGKNQACGLAFSVSPGQRIPPSLKNVYKELQRTHGNIHAQEGDLTSWAQQGILLLNTVLTVRAGKALSHKRLGWETFTDAAISFISKNHRGAFFFLWGRQAQKKSALITCPPHAIFASNHPSPLSQQPFIGCNCFIHGDQFLENLGEKKIFW